jgi:hypothetical protein
LIALLFPLLGLIFVWRLKILSKILIKPDHNYVSLYTIMISNVDFQYKESLIKEFKELYGEDEVVNAFIVYDLEKLITNNNRKKECEKQLLKAKKIFDQTGI